MEKFLSRNPHPLRKNYTDPYNTQYSACVLFNAHEFISNSLKLFHWGIFSHQGAQQWINLAQKIYRVPFPVDVVLGDMFGYRFVVKNIKRKCKPGSSLASWIPQDSSQSPARLLSSSLKEIHFFIHVRVLHFVSRVYFICGLLKMKNNHWIFCVYISNHLCSHVDIEGCIFLKGFKLV